MEKLMKKHEAKIKASAASMDNYGNFFGQNLFLANSGVLLIANTLSELGYATTGLDIAKASSSYSNNCFCISFSSKYITRQAIRKKVWKEE